MILSQVSSPSHAPRYVWRFPGSDILFTLMLFGMFIPYQSILIPLVQLLQAMKLHGSIPGLILVHVVYGLPITTLIFPFAADFVVANWLE